MRVERLDRPPYHGRRLRVAAVPTCTGDVFVLRVGTLLAVRHDGEGKPKTCATLRAVLDPDSACVRLDNRLGDRQSQTGTAGFSITRGIRSIESLEDMLPLLFGHSGTGIANRDNGFLIVKMGATLFVLPGFPEHNLM